MNRQEHRYLSEVRGKILLNHWLVIKIIDDPVFRDFNSGEEGETILFFRPSLKVFWREILSA